MLLRAVQRIVKQMRRWHNLRRLSFIDSGSDSSIYNSTPRLSAVVQLFNKRHNIELIVAALKSGDVDEIIVVDDGSSDGAIDVLPRLLTGKNQFVIRSNDLFEVRTYSRAIDFARGEIVVLLQDDDLPPSDGGWISEAINLFAQYPKLAILGGLRGLDLQINGSNTISYSIQSPTAKLGKRAYFDFAQVVNRAPMFVRRSTVQALGGIDQIFAPFQCDDVDLCLKAWLNGFQVGLYRADFARDVGMGGMHLFNADKIGPQAARNWGIIAERYGSRIAAGRFAVLVNEARREIKIS